jgi:ligand-binding SRPBCC domain-containing protein
MALNTFETSQKFPTSAEQIWNFISSPQNLKHITPENLRFNIITKNLPKKMYLGMIIAYNVRPLLGIKRTWVTEITQVKELEFFVDEQRIGPFKFCHHQHRLKSIPGGILMQDIVNYQPPFGFLGSIANTLFIKKILKNIFQFRTLKLEKIFGKL